MNAKETRWLGQTHRHEQEVGSTNDVAASWARSGAPHGAMVTADTQTQGRGRRGRGWTSPPGQLYVSWVLRPQATEALAALGLAVGVGLREGLGREEVGLKWPNDLVVRGRKLGGILCEGRWGGERAEFVVGVGLNILPVPREGSSISLASLGDTRSAAEVLVTLLPCLEDVLDSFFAGGFAAISEDYARVSTVLGHRVCVEGATAGAYRFGDAVGVANDGALLVRFADAEAPERVEAGDVSVRLDGISKT